jgi:hypothetical protein
MESKYQNRPVYPNKAFIRFEIKSLASSSCFQPRFRTRSAKSPPKNRISLEKMTIPNLQEKNTPEFLEEYGT